MKFEFDSLGELDEFVQYLFNARAHAERIASAAASIASETPVPDAQLTPEERANALQAVREWAEGEVRTNAAPQTEPEPPKRKRRTKAEIEADKAAAAAGAPIVETPAPSDAQATAATSPLAGANPFDASTSNAPAATAALNEAPAGTTGTLSALGGTTVEERVLTLEAAAVAQAAKADAALEAAPTDLVGVDPQSYIALRVAEMGGAFDAREHMKKCVEFIGALGKARYDEAFDLAGTSRSVATYTPADCAKHIAALEYLQLSGKGA